MDGQVSAVRLFSRVSSDGGVVRQARSPRCFAERESIVLFFFPSPPCFFFFCPLFPHILNLYSIPAKCQDPWGRCTKSVLPSQLVNNDGVCRRHRLKSPLHAFALDAILPSGELCLFHEKIMATRGVQPLCLTWIPAVWTVRHVLWRRRAARRRRRVVSLTLLVFFFFSLPLSLSENPWCALLALLCRPGENVIGGVIYLRYLFIYFKLVTFYCLNANNECVCFLFNCPTENMATHSSKGSHWLAVLPLSKAEQTDQEVVFGLGICSRCPCSYYCILLFLKK